MSIVESNLVYAAPTLHKLGNIRDITLFDSRWQCSSGGDWHDEDDVYKGKHRKRQRH